MKLPTLRDLYPERRPAELAAFEAETALILTAIVLSEIHPDEGDYQTQLAALRAELRRGAPCSLCVRGVGCDGPC